MFESVFVYEVNKKEFELFTKEKAASEVETMKKSRK